MPDEMIERTPILYEIRLAGRIDLVRMAWFEGIAITQQQTGEETNTILSVSVRDQSALFGILTRIRDLGIRLISINPQMERKSGE